MEEEGGRLPGREADVGLGKGQAVKMENKKEEGDVTERRERELNVQLGDNRGRRRDAAVEGRGSRPGHGGQFPGFPSSVRSFSSNGSLLIDGGYFQTATEVSKHPPVKQNLSESPSLISFSRRLQGPARVGDGQWDNGRKMHDSIGDMSVSASVSARRDTGRRWDNWDSMTEQSDSETGSKASLSEFSLSDRSSLTSSVTAETEISESESGTEREDVDEEKEASESETESRSGSEGERTEPSRTSSRGRSHDSRRRSGTGGKNSWSSRSGRHRRGSSRHSSSTVSSSRPKTSRCTCAGRDAPDQESEENSDVEEERKRVKPRKSSVGRRAPGHVQPVVGSGVMDAPDDLWPIIEEEERSSVYSGEGREDQEEGGVWGKESAA